MVDETAQSGLKISGGHIGGRRFQPSTAGRFVFRGHFAPAFADIVTDGTVGPAAQLSGPEFQIGAELGTRAGRNLFHSFQRFNLQTGERATFSGPDAIKNIIGRVTGGARSEIDGTIRSAIPGADLFFINPSGIVFGPNAALDLQGSFHVSTADEVRFADGTRFSASNSVGSSFTVAAPEAFGFIGGQPAPILIDRARLSVPQHQTVSLVGGDITIEGQRSVFLGARDEFTANLQAEAGEVNLISLRGSGHVSAKDFNVSRPGASSGGTVKVSDVARVNVSGDGGGTIRIHADEFVLEDESNLVTRNTGALDAVTGVTFHGGSMIVESGSRITTETVSEGDAGHIAISADRLILRSGSDMSSGTFVGASGAGGDIIIGAEHVVVSGRASIRVGASLSPPSPQFPVPPPPPPPGPPAAAPETPSGSLPPPPPPASPVSILTQPAGAGNAGTLIIRADKVVIRDGAAVSSSTFTTGSGGLVDVRAKRIELSNGTQVENVTSASDFREIGVISSSTFGTGKAGTVKVAADRLILQEGGQIRSTTFATGAAGEVTVEASRGIVVTGRDPSGFGSAILAGADDSLRGLDPDSFQPLPLTGPGGNVRVVSPSVLVTDGGIIGAGSDGTGLAGTIFIEAAALRMEGGVITTEAERSGGGVIFIAGDQLVDLRRDSRIATTIRDAGGSLTIDAAVVVLDSSQILLNAQDPQFRPLVGTLIRSPDSTIELNSIPADLSDVETRLDIESVPVPIFVPPPLREPCATRRDVGASSFTRVGRGGLPRGPADMRVSSYLPEVAPAAEGLEIPSSNTRRAAERWPEPVQVAVGCERIR